MGGQGLEGLGRKEKVQGKARVSEGQPRKGKVQGKEGRNEKS